MSDIQISMPEESIRNGKRVLSASVDGVRVEFQFPEFMYIRSIGDAYIATCLLEAMATGRNIQVCTSLPVSSALMDNLPQLQEIYRCWNKDLTQVDVAAQHRIDSAGNRGAASFFSAGIDGSYTLLQRSKDISHLIMLNSFEGWDSPREWQSFLEKQEKFSVSQGKQIVEVSGNFRHFTEDRQISHHFQHGLELGGIASALGFERTYIPSSFTADQLFPWGSHPLTDPLWGGGATRVIHHGYECGRTSKTAALANNQSLLDNLQVCWAYVDHNCGQCAKCLRTMLALKLLGQTSQSLPELMDFSEGKKLKIGSLAALPFAIELRDLAEQRGEIALMKLLDAKIRRFQLRQYFGGFINLITRNRLKPAYHRLVGTKWAQARVTMTTTSIQMR